MATLPQAADYGARVQLRSDRIDVPGSGELAVASALERAAGTFAGMAIQHKQKDDALSYSNAKNEYLIADIQERDKLQDDQDFATHDERYRTAMNGHYERLFPTVKSTRDRSLFDVEARLMNERGAVAVGDNARTKEIDWNVSTFRRHGTELQAVIMAAKDAQTAQDAMFAYLNHANSLLDAGYLTPDEHRAETQGFVTVTARSRLIAMEPRDREAMLERSITMARTQGSPITRDQIQKGEGSGSLADFIPLDERVAMLEATRKGNDHDATMTEAYEVFDEVRANHDDPAKVGAAIREASKGLDSDVRTALDAMNTRYRQSVAAEESAEVTRIMKVGSQMIGENKNPEDMDGEEWMKLQEFQKESLREAYIAKLENREFGEFDVQSRPAGEKGMSYAKWMQIPREQRAHVTLESPEWKMSFTPSGWALLLRDQEAIKKELDSGKVTPRTPGPTVLQRVSAALVADGTIPQTGRDDKHNKIYWTTVMNYHLAIAAAEDVKNGKLTTEEEEVVFARMMEDRAFTDSYYTGSLWPGGPETDPDEAQRIATMPPETLNKARKELSPNQTTVHGGQKMTHRQKLETMGVNIGLNEGDISEYDLARANFALVNLIGTEGQRYNLSTITPAEMKDVDLEIERRLRGN